MTGTPAASATNRPILASRSHCAQSWAPQPLNTQSTAATDPSEACTNVGPISRIQASFSGASMISIALERYRSAAARSFGSTTTVTGSNSATAWATAAQVARASWRA